MDKSNGTELSVSYASAFGEVSLTSETVKKYLVRGNAAVSDQEILLFMELCKYQKLNPFTNEVFLIKFGNDPAQAVVGRDAYLRRAYENPDYLGYESGITVLRGNDVVQKSGACIYPGEKVIGGWAKVRRKLNGIQTETFKEAGLSEYDRGIANWKSKPALMICKVAESQALRAAFPIDYAGIYSMDEIGDAPEAMDTSCTSPEPELLIDKAQRQELFKAAKEKFGANANDCLSTIIKGLGYQTTDGMTVSAWEKAMGHIAEWADGPEPSESEDAEVANEVSEVEAEPDENQ